MSTLTYDITDKDVQWMREQYRTRFGLEINNEAAYRKLQSLVRQMELVYRPITKQRAKGLKNMNENINAKPPTPHK